ncbi:hypothetical protein [Luteimonas aquatica]|uniref:hypothetical protein n=1 Tax=Luteimonas aquatica TaxID=450364 RepID=UPI001F59316D|nr:hypothetical protein [Luteimonas aquatica]
MPRAILHRLLSTLCALALCLPMASAGARVLSAKIARVSTPVATLQGVEVRLDWPARAAGGELQLRASRVEAPDLGYRFRDLRWRCPLSRDAQGGWRCDGVLQAPGAAPMRLSLSLATASTDAALSRGPARFALHRSAATPDDTELVLTRVPLAWAQALASQAWAAGQFKRGTLDGRLTVRVPAKGPLRVDGRLALADGALETPDASIAADKLDGVFRIDYRKPGKATLLSVDGELRGGELLFGSTYIALADAAGRQPPARLRIDALQRPGEGWRLPAFEWHDGGVLQASGSAALTREATLDRLDLDLRSDDLAPLGERYLSGTLGVAGLAGLRMRGALEAKLAIAGGSLSRVDARLHEVSLEEANKRFAFEGLDGDLRYSDGAAVDSALRWRSAALDRVALGAATLPWRSAGGELRARETVAIPVLDGSMRIDGLTLRPPAAGHGMQLQFGLELDGLDIGKLSTSLGGPAFRGTLSGRIPLARYAEERIDFDGGLSMQAFGGTIAVSALSMERPFGVAPTLSADLGLQGLDLLSITEVFDFGSISGRLEGRVDNLRLVDWTPTAFDAELHTVARRGVRQRLSQRAVQNISSVGDASIVTSLQGRLIGLFDDFGYRRIGLSCRLENEICLMGGLHSAGAGFTIVEGAGIPRLNVVGFNRRVDWPTLVERVAAVGKGEVKPVFE